MDFNYQQLKQVTRWQTSIMGVMLFIITVLAGFWANSMKEGQTELVHKFDKLIDSVNDLRVNDAKQQQEIDYTQHQIQRVLEAEQKRIYPDPSPPEKKPIGP